MNTIQISEEADQHLGPLGGLFQHESRQIWNTPSPDAIASIAHAKYIDSAVVAFRPHRNICFMVSPFG